MGRAPPGELTVGIRYTRCLLISMAPLGRYLSGLREERGLSIEEVARVTRVASCYLNALEHEDFAALPASVFTRGYIRAYCQALGVPADDALTRYSASVDAVITPATVAQRAAKTSDAKARSRGTLLMSFVLLVGFGLALSVMALFLQSGRPESGARHPQTASARVEPGAAGSATPSIASSPAAVSPPVVSPVTPAPPPPRTAPPSAAVPRPADPKPTPETRPAGDVTRSPGAVVDAASLQQLGGVVSPYRLVARTSESTWLRVRTEDGRATEETIPPGEVREWISNRPFVVTIGNAAGVALELNGQKLPPLGGRGVVIGRLILPPAEP